MNLSVVMDLSKQQEVEKSHRRLKRTYKVAKLIQLVDTATRNFVAVSEEIANENPEFQVILPSKPNCKMVLKYCLGCNCNLFIP